MQTLDGLRLLFFIYFVDILKLRLLYFTACTAVFDHVYMHVGEELANIDPLWTMIFAWIFKVDLMQRSDQLSFNTCMERLRLFRPNLIEQLMTYSTPLFAASSLALLLTSEPSQSPSLLPYMVFKLLKNARYRCSSSSVIGLP